MSTRNGALRLDLIIRTSKRKKDARSPKQQEDYARGAALAGGHEIAFVHDSGKDESGKTMDRASIHSARDRVRAGEVDGVIFGLTDRVGRAPIEETMTVVRELGRIGYLVLADLGPTPIDLTYLMAETMLVNQLQYARQFWLMTARRFRQSQIDALAAGRFVGPTPLGYVREGGRLHEHPTLGKVIREAYKRAARDGLHAAIDYLAIEVPDRDWTTYGARRLLAGRAYLGESWIWIPKDDRDPDGEKVRKVNPAAHGALTDLGTWQAAQTAPRRRRTNGDYPLSGIATCGECGGSFVGQLQTMRGRQYRRYRCGRCARASINADRLEDWVRERLRWKVKTGGAQMHSAPRGLEGSSAGPGRRSGGADRVPDEPCPVGARRRFHRGCRCPSSCG